MPISSVTLAFYRNAAAKFLAFLGDEADRDLTEITRDDITQFRNEEAKNCAPKTVNHKVKFLRMVFRAARRDALVGDDPAEFVDPVRKSKGAPRRPFTVPELKAVLSIADGEWRSMIMFGIYTGQRLADIASLTWQNIDLQRGEILGRSSRGAPPLRAKLLFHPRIGFGNENTHATRADF